MSKPIRIWLDDIRPAPEGWLWVKTVEDFTDAMTAYRGHVVAVSFDHDLGEDEASGHGAAAWLEIACVTDGYPVPREMACHSANPVGRQRIDAAIAGIRRWATASGGRRT